MHPVSSQKKLDSVNINVIDDCIRRDLIENNFGVLYPDHLDKLTKLFHDCNFHVPKEIIACEDDIMKSTVKPEYAFLDKDSDNIVQMSVITIPSKIYVQKMNSVSTLLDLMKNF